MSLYWGPEDWGAAIWEYEKRRLVKYSSDPVNPNPELPKAHRAAAHPCPWRNG
jgi:hypothetical protein